MPDALRELDILVQRELGQLAEEGVDVGPLRAQYAAAADLRPDDRHVALAEILSRAEPLAVYETPEEPGALEAIRALRPPPVPLGPAPSGAELASRIRGGWYGRVAGCLLGKPLEGALNRKDDIAAYLRATDSYPLLDYVPTPPPPLAERYRFHRSAPRSTRGQIQGMPRDDDIDYPILNLLILETYGPDWTLEQAAEEWLVRLSYHTIYAAGRAAYRNMVNGMAPPETARYRNGNRQSLGGQIRADVWGWTCPGDPERAAELAYRDSIITQTRNGIYGGMFFAAVIAAAFAGNVSQAVEAGLAQVPRDCTLARSVREAVGWVEEGVEYEEALRRIDARYGHQVANYSIVNAVLSVLGPLYAPDDYSRAIGLTVMGGYDTDCTGATAGSIMGVAMGEAGIPARWTEPLDDRYDSYVVGIGRVAISELAERTLRAAV